MKNHLVIPISSKAPAKGTFSYPLNVPAKLLLIMYKVMIYMKKKSFKHTYSLLLLPTFSQFLTVTGTVVDRAQHTFISALKS